MKHAKSLTYLLCLFLVAQIIGMLVGFEIHRAIYVEKTVAPLISEPTSPQSSFIVFLPILAMTAVILFLIKKGFNKIMRALMFLSIFAGLNLTLGEFLGVGGLLVSIITTTAFIVYHKKMFVANNTLLLAISGLGGFLGAQLELIPAFILLTLLSVYDFIAVFGTKHMVTLAKEGSKQLPLLFSIPVGERRMGLGTGDLAIPIVFTSAVARTSPQAAILTSLMGSLGLATLFYYTTNKENITLPALPPIAIGQTLGYLMSLIFL